MFGINMEELRKFGLDYCDLPTMLSNIAKLLRVITVNIEDSYTKRLPFIYYIITIVLATCYFYVFLISVVWFVVVRCRITQDRVTAMVVVSLGIASEIGNLKLIYMYLHMDKVKKIAQDYLQLDSLDKEGSRFRRNLLIATRTIKKRAMTYWMILMINGVFYNMKPVVMPGRNLADNHLVLYGLEPPFESPNFEIGFVMMAIGVCFIVYVPANVTAYLIVIVGYSEAQLLALGKEALQLWPDAVQLAKKELDMEEIDETDRNTRIVINKYVTKMLQGIINRHAYIIKLFGNVEDMFRDAIAMGFILLVFALLSELLGGLENTYLQMPFAFMQVAMDCFTGQRLIDACDVYEQNVYDCQWENFDKTNMKMVHVMLQNSQKTLALTAGGLSQLRFSVLMTITRGIYSAYTALSASM